jgi:hypothetical protein
MILKLNGARRQHDSRHAVDERLVRPHAAARQPRSGPRGGRARRPLHRGTAVTALVALGTCLLAATGGVGARPFLSADLHARAGSVAAPFATRSIPEVRSEFQAYSIVGCARWMLPPWQLGVRLPVATSSVEQPAGSYVADYTFGNPEVFVERGVGTSPLRLKEGLRWPLQLAPGRGDADRGSRSLRLLGEEPGARRIRCRGRLARAGAVPAGGLADRPRDVHPAARSALERDRGAQATDFSSNLARELSVRGVGPFGPRARPVSWRCMARALLAHPRREHERDLARGATSPSFARRGTFRNSSADRGPVRAIPHAFPVRALGSSRRDRRSARRDPQRRRQRGRSSTAGGRLVCTSTPIRASVMFHGAETRVGAPTRDLPARNAFVVHA